MINRRMNSTELALLMIEVSLARLAGQITEDEAVEILFNHLSSSPAPRMGDYSPYSYRKPGYRW